MNNKYNMFVNNIYINIILISFIFFFFIIILLLFFFFCIYPPSPFRYPTSRDSSSIGKNSPFRYPTWRGSSSIGNNFRWNRLSVSASRSYSFRPLRLRVTRSSLPTLSSSTRVTGSSWKKARIHGLSIFVDKAEAIVVSIHSPSLFTPPFRHAHTNSETRFRNAKSRMGETCRKDQKCCKGCLLGHNQFWPNSAYRWADSGHSYH